MEETKLELQKEREFGDVFNATFAFIQQEFKLLGKAILVFVVPILLLMSIALVLFQTSNMNMLRSYDPADPSSILQNLPGMFGGLFIYLVIVLIGQSVFAGVIYSYLKLYLQRKGDVKFEDIFVELRKCFLPIVGASILASVVIFVGLMFCILPGIYLAISLSMFIPILVIENNGFGNAFSRSFNITHKQWWWTFLIILVGGIMVWVVSFIFSIPSMIFGFTKMFHSIRNHQNPYEMMTTGYIVYTSIVSAVTQLLYIVPYLLIGFQYFNIVEIMERPSLTQKIEQLGPNE